MVPGTKIMLGEKEYVVPALTLGMLRNGMAQKLKEHDELIASGNFGPDLLLLRAEIIVTALRRNYPDASDDDLYNSLDMGNLMSFWEAVIGATGLGEAIAARAAGADTTSNPSIQLSPPPTDGASQ